MSEWCPCRAHGSLAACSQAEVNDDGRICEECISPDDPHPLIDAQLAEDLGLITATYRKSSMFCAYKFCKQAAACKSIKCGEGSQRQQAGRSKAQSYCMHPNCRRAFHPTCYSID